MAAGAVRVKLQIALVAAVIRGSGKRYVTIKDVSKMLGVSTRTAGRILARLEREGYLERYSRSAYRVVAAGCLEPPESPGKLPKPPEGYGEPEEGEEGIAAAQPLPPSHKAQQ